jgi:uncharacterized cupredoxin-like copper-binding protein
MRGNLKGKAACPYSVYKRRMNMKHLIHWSVGSLLLILFLVGCGGGGTPANSGATATSGTMSGQEHVEVTENEYTITSSVSTFTAGTPYHFVVKNTGSDAHEFMIMPKDEGSMGSMSMDHMDGIALAKTGDINPGETKTIDYTFPASTKGTHPQFVCYVGGHYDKGMKLDVNVS